MARHARPYIWTGMAGIGKIARATPRNLAWAGEPIAATVWTGADARSRAAFQRIGVYPTRLVLRVSFRSKLDRTSKDLHGTVGCQLPDRALA